MKKLVSALFGLSLVLGFTSSSTHGADAFNYDVAGKKEDLRCASGRLAPISGSYVCIKLDPPICVSGTLKPVASEVDTCIDSSSKSAPVAATCVSTSHSHCVRDIYGVKCDPKDKCMTFSAPTEKKSPSITPAGSTLKK